MSDKVYGPKSDEAKRARPLFQMPPSAVLSPNVADQLAIVARLEEQARHNIAEGRERGRREGYAEAIARCLEAVQAAEATTQQRIESAKSDLIRLAIGVAEQIVCHEVTSDPELLAGIVEEQRRCMGTGEVVCTAGPEAFSLLRDNWPGDRMNTTVLKQDPAAAPWSMRLDGVGGTIKAGFERQLEAVANHLLRSQQQPY